MDLTHIDILSVIGGNYKDKHAKDGEYAGPCPSCGGDDRFIIRTRPEDGNNPNYWCRQCGIRGDALDYLTKERGMGFVDAMQQLGLEVTSANGTTDSKRGYRDLSDYATQHGLDANDLIESGWVQVTHQDRPAIEFNTKGGKRYRFLDGDMPSYKSEYGFTPSWYAFSDKVIKLAKDTNAPLFLCNGEISTISARFWGVPAICVAGGGEKQIPDDLLKELLSRWDGRIAIAMDCDEAGRKASAKIAEQLGKRGVIVDLGLEDKQDLADYARLYGGKSLSNLKRLIPLPVGAPVSSREAASRTTESLDINSPVEGKPIIMPYSIYHKFGGYALVCMPSKITAVAAMSGHGKTSWLNFGTDTLLRDGDNGVGLMPEFDNEEYQWDRIQRYTGKDGLAFVTTEDMMMYKLWRYEHQNNIPSGKRKGRDLTKEQKRAVVQVNNMVEAWDGQFHLYDANASLETTFLEMGDYIQSKKGTPENVTFAAFDYLQILDARGLSDNDNVYEGIMGLIKKFIMQHKIHAFVSSQVNKTADKGSREQGRLLASTDLRYVRDDKVNCLITLNPTYDDSGEMVQLGGMDGCYASVANIAKNTKGRKGLVNQIANFKHLSYLDQSFKTQVHSTEDFA